MAEDVTVDPPVVPDVVVTEPAAVEPSAEPTVAPDVTEPIVGEPPSDPVIDPEALLPVDDEPTEPAIAIDPNDIDALLATQPEGSHVEYVGGLYNFYRGPGRTSHGQGKTVLRAIQTVNASYQKNPYNETSVLVDEHGDVLPPE